MVKQIGARLAARGFSEQNILISASHTHSGPGGFANFPTLNTTAPSLETAGDPNSFAALLNPAPTDPQLYTFLVEQIEAAIRRADDDLDPALAGWGSSTLLGITRNRSLRLTSPTTASCASTARAASRRTPADTGTRSFRRQRAPSRQAAAQARCLRASRRGLTVLPARAHSDWRLPAPRSPARASRRS